jgi:ubiquinone/menaquinone biosynthesis C-methylase UbiE
METPDNYDVFAHYYEEKYASVVMDIELYTEMARRAGATARILELACGNGRVTLPLIELGFNVTGLDYSEGMLNLARRKVQALSPEMQRRARFVKGDMRDFDFGNEKFDLIFIPLNSFQHLLDHNAQLACLERVHAHLAPMGRFVLTTFNPEEKESYPADGRVELDTTLTASNGNTLQVFFSTTADPSQQLRHYTYFFDEIAPDGTLKRTVANLRLRYTYRFEMELLLDKAGFALEDFYGSYDFEEYGNGSSILVYICRSKGYN